MLLGSVHGGRGAGFRLRLVVALSACVVLLASCGRAAQPPVGSLSSSHPCAPAEIGATGSAAPNAFLGSAPAPRFTCASLTVPLDHGLLPGPRSSELLRLDVAMSDNPAPRRGVLVWLVGGPGSPGSRMAAEIASQLDPTVLAQYRLVLMSGRGTGAGALVCPKLQDVMGSSDLAVPSAAAVSDCANRIGDDRRFYSTRDTVEDLELLRRALGVERLTLDGASYGTYLAERYAISHPDRVDRMVLDSVVPHDGFDPLDVTAFNATAQVLGMACAQIHCTTDPAQDLAQVIRDHHNGPQLLDALTARTGGAPQLSDLPAALHAGALGQMGPLDAIVAGETRGQATPAQDLSQGLHAATECQDMHGPWGDASTPAATRAAATLDAVAALPAAALYPFDAATAAGNGAVVTCQLWPPTPVVPLPTSALLPPVPVLLLAGDHDIDTPLALTQHEAGLAPNGRLVVVAGSGHITQDLTNPPAGRTAITRFLLDDQG
jgi:pimeloyl-ACP methyl ester carboxylesterase